MKGLTKITAQGNIKYETLGLEKLIYVATTVRPVSHWYGKGRCVNRA